MAREFYYPTTEEQQKVIMAFCHESRTQDEMVIAINWARETYIMNQYLQAVIAGECELGLKDGDLTFRVLSDPEEITLQRTMMSAVEIANLDLPDLGEPDGPQDKEADA